MINLIVSHEMWTLKLVTTVQINTSSLYILLEVGGVGGNTGLRILMWKGAVNLERELESIWNSTWYLRSGLHEV